MQQFPRRSKQKTIKNHYIPFRHWKKPAGSNMKCKRTIYLVVAPADHYKANTEEYIPHKPSKQKRHIANATTPKNAIS